MGWPLEARRSLFPDWLWLCDESSPHRRALHIPVQIMARKFKMEFLPTISLLKAFPVYHRFVLTCMKSFPAVQSLTNNLMVVMTLLQEAFKAGSKGWD